MKQKIENPNAIKNLISDETVKKLAQGLKKADPKFDSTSFLKVIPKLQPLELKARVQAISSHMNACLPKDYLKALKIVMQAAVNTQYQTFDLWPVSDWIENHGLNHEVQSLQAMKILTTKFTAEFAVRPFLIQNPKLAFQFLKKNATSKNVHIRRWSSEGSRPRLPWGQKLKKSIDDPKPGLEILEHLKYDPELYVRKSVANHLNDISKDHPELVVQTLKRWKKDCPQESLSHLKWIQNHALRTLIKKGNPLALELLGFGGKLQVQLKDFSINKTNYKLGDDLNFKFKIKSESSKTQNLVLDYVINYRKANGKLSSKVYKLKNMTLKAGEAIEIEKIHRLKVITTRTFYSGLHQIAIQVNGKQFKALDWNLKVY
jgi:3-methyladenine DNA glycosylase AlkC